MRQVLLNGRLDVVEPGLNQIVQRAQMILVQGLASFHYDHDTVRCTQCFGELDSGPYRLAHPVFNLALHRLRDFHYLFDFVRLLLVELTLDRLFFFPQTLSLLVNPFPPGVSLLLQRSLHTHLFTTQVLVQSLESLGTRLLVDPGDDILGEVQHSVQIAARDIKQQPHIRRHTACVPDVGNRSCQLDVPHPLTTHR